MVVEAHLMIIHSLLKITIMKKIITLIGAVMLFTVAFAQDDRGNRKNDDDYDHKDMVYNDSRHRNHDDRGDDRYAFNHREREMQIARINREYDRKIASVKHNWFMSRSKKIRMVRSLEDQRIDEIRMLSPGYNHRNNRFDDHDSRRHW
jgi:hypothetical protein